MGLEIYFKRHQQEIGEIVFWYTIVWNPGSQIF